MKKIETFKEFVRSWVRGIREPEAPELDIDDTLLGRLERAFFTVVSIIGIVGLIANPLVSAFLVKNPIGVALVFGWILGILLAVIGVFGIFALSLGVIRLGDYVIRGDDSDDAEDWAERIAEFLWEALTRPVSWAIAVATHLPSLRRFRRETQAYFNAKMKAETVWSDLNRPDAEDLFAGIDDVTMLEGLLRK